MGCEGAVMKVAGKAYVACAHPVTTSELDTLAHGEGEAGDEWTTRRVIAAAAAAGAAAPTCHFMPV